MKTTKNWNKVFLAVMVLSFGLVLAGCPKDPDDSVDSSLNGTWSSGSGEEKQTIEFDNGNFEMSQGGVAMLKGTYTTDNGEMTIKGTHLWGAVFALLGLKSEWYSKDDLKTELTAKGIPDEAFNEEFGAMFTESTGPYSVSGNKLTMTLGDEPETYTKQ